MNEIIKTDSCAQCGQANSVANSHCDFCGVKLPWAKAPNVAQTSSEPTEARQHFLARDDNRVLTVASGCVSGAVACALPYGSSALVLLMKGDHIKATDGMGNAIAAALFGCFWGFTAAYFLGRLAATVIVPPVLLILSMYFLMQYPH